MTDSPRRAGGPALADPAAALAQLALNDPAAALAQLALDEDLAGGTDATTTATVPADHVSTGDLVARTAGTIAGTAVCAAVFYAAGAAEVAVHLEDGAPVGAGTTVLSVTGPTRATLTAERSALNLVGHLSGVATLTARWVAAVDGTGAVIRDTRKTTPGLRALEKSAVRAGGGQNHRMSLGTQALIKDNHIVAAGGVTEAIRAVRRDYPDLICEVECDTVEQVDEAVRAGATLVLLDNMSSADLSAAVAIARGATPVVRTEASGGLTIDRAREVAETGVDFISVGALTHSAPVLDIGLDLRQLR